MPCVSLVRSEPKPYLTAVESGKCSLCTQVRARGCINTKESTAGTGVPWQSHGTTLVFFMVDQNRSEHVGSQTITRLIRGKSEPCEWCRSGFGNRWVWHCVIRKAARRTFFSLVRNVRCPLFPPYTPTQTQQTVPATGFQTHLTDVQALELIRWPAYFVHR